MVSRKRERRIAAAVGSFALVGATASMAVAAQGALPGETLYPLKRAIENAQAIAQGDEDTKGTTILSNAAGRLDEIDELSREDQGQDPAVISSTLDTFAEQAVEASDLLIEAYDKTGRPELIDDVRVFAAESMSSLRALEPLVPRESRVALIRASQALRAIDQDAVKACPTCSAAILDQAPLLATTSYDELVTDLVNATTQPSNTSKNKEETRKGKRKGAKSGPKGASSPDEEPQVSVTTKPSNPVSAPDKKDDQSGTKPPKTPKTPKNPVKDLTDKLLNGGNTNGSKPDQIIEETVKNLTDPLFP